VLDQYTDIGAPKTEGKNVIEFERYVLIKERVEKTVSRVKRWIALKDKTKTEHK
jgi:cobalamin biosynthesis Mg chelatase CobN